jgi:YbgC/YbaW family acyl-CoA thioester hydrolase
MPPHVSTTTHLVGMIDVDQVQIHFASYLPWVDGAFSTLLEELGRPLQEILSAGEGTPVVDLHCSYRSPVGLGDRLVARTWVDRVGTSSFTVRHEFSCRERVVAVVDATHVWISTEDGPPSPRPLPAWLVAAADPAATPPHTGS